jgi:dipicolinate synthase subunit A
MLGIILKDDKRYDYCENYLKNRGYTFCSPETPPQSLDFIIFPFMGVVDDSYDDSFFAALKSTTLIFSGIKNAELSEKCEKYGLEYHPIIEDRAVATKNAVPTSEGVIAYLITNRKKTIANSRVLIIGYGLCGSDLAKRMKALGADVHAVVRNREKESAAYTDSVTPMYLEEMFEKQPFDIIVNTVPEQILSNEMLDKTEKAVLIDIASKPYGFDINYAKKLNDKSALLPGIPGKHASQTAGEILGEYIYALFGRK